MRPHIRGIGMTSQRTRDRLIERLREKGIRNEQVLEVIRRTPRHLFVDEALSSRAYEDTALPIGFNQTISQPYIVARMTEILLANNPQKVLEVGTGSAYQAAVLAQLVPKVYTVERILALLPLARQRLRELNLRNVSLKQSDGTWGWPQQAPFDAILVTAAPAEIPKALLEQLVDGGRLVIPVGAGSDQTLAVITRHGDRYTREDIESVTFVPLVGGGA
ncbi:MAG: protein-L-isoaspartate(D-aspartate) O-methyltransferase [Gammaproteobacteria bacterium]|nr:protein-L-isoaspartate(D-aspartate) O-methyltransferase [Gammaproteobacteria bacterium]